MYRLGFVLILLAMISASGCSNKGSGGSSTPYTPTAAVDTSHGGGDNSGDTDNGGDDDSDIPGGGWGDGGDNGGGGDDNHVKVCQLRTMPSAPNLNSVEEVPFNSGNSSYASYSLYPFSHYTHYIKDVVVSDAMDFQIDGYFGSMAIWGTHYPLVNEKVSAFIYNYNASRWESLGTKTTSAEGKVSFIFPNRQDGDYLVRMVVLGDLSETYGTVSFVKRDRKVIVFNVDGTLTKETSILSDYFDLSDDEPYVDAAELTRFYYEKGYQVVYNTGRMDLAINVHRWLFENHFAPGPVMTVSADSILEYLTDKDKLKEDNLVTIREAAGLQFSALYGDSAEDMTSYQAVVGDSKIQSGEVTLYYIGSSFTPVSVPFTDIYCNGSCSYESHLSSLIESEENYCGLME